MQKIKIKPGNLRIILHNYIHTIGTKTLTFNEDDDKTASAGKGTHSPSELTTATVAEDNMSNEDSMSQPAGNEMDEDFKTWEDDEQNLDEDQEQSVKSSSPSQTNSLNSPADNDDWNKLEWPSIEPQTSSWEQIADAVPVSSASGSTNGASAFNGNKSNSLLKVTASLRSSKNSLSATESDSSLKGRLNQTDIERLEEQAKWASMEIDYFADMQPVITNSKPSVSSLTSKQTAVTNSTPPASAITNKLNYVPDEEVCMMHKLMQTFQVLI